MISLAALPDELLLSILSHLDVPDLLSISRTCHHLRKVSLDPLLHRRRLRSSVDNVNYLLPRRPPLHTLQPPNSTIYLTRTHVAARRLHWSLVCIRLNRSLARRPKLSALIAANILPKECFRIDRGSGDLIWGSGVAGPLVERKRRIERERLKEGLRVWLERKARKIPSHRRDGGVGVLVWKFSKMLGLPHEEHVIVDQQPTKKERVSGLKRFWESMSNG